jgi:DNA-binding transcriptional regulator YiaG
MAKKRLPKKSRKTATKKKTTKPARRARPTKRPTTRRSARRRPLQRKKRPTKRATPALSVERSLLKKRDKLRKAPYAGGRDFPSTVEQQRGASPALKKTATCKEVRAHLGLSQDDFARLVGLNHATVEIWESGARGGREPKPWQQALFGALMGSQAPRGSFEIRRSMKDVGEVRTVFELLKSAFEGPRLAAARA